MRYLWLSLLAVPLVISVWAADWPMPGGNPQRNGWAGSERRINKANVGSLKLLYKYQTDNQSRGIDGLSAPIVDGNLITYRGFKEMLMFTGSSDKVFSVDADLNKLVWEVHLPYAASIKPTESSTAACPGGLTAPVVMAGSSSASLHFAAIAARRPAGIGVRARRPSPYFPPLAQSVYPLLPTTLTQLNAAYTVSSDGYLHVLNSSTGQDLIPSFRFVPPNAKVTSLNLRDNIVYATTADNCDGYQNALFALDILSPDKKVNSFVLPQGGFAGTGGTAIGNDGTVYVQVAFPSEKQPRHYYDTVVALTPKDLKVKDYFTVSNKPLKEGKDGAAAGITPVVFSFPNRDLVLAGGRDGRLYLLDSRSLGGADHHTPLFRSAPLAESRNNNEGNGFRGIFSTWMDVDTGTRRFYVPIFGKLRPSVGLKTDDHGTGNGVIAAFELQGTTERPTLSPIWISHNMASPAPAVIAAGMVLVLATGDNPHVASNIKPHSVAEREQMTQSASLYVLDAITGKQLYSSGSTGPGSSLSAALAFANGRAYFTARDNAVYCFGIPGQQSQLTQQ
jgi:outer membrane protein assembly factor BamB